MPTGQHFSPEIQWGPVGGGEKGSVHTQSPKREPVAQDALPPW